MYFKIILISVIFFSGCTIKKKQLEKPSKIPIIIPIDVNSTKFTPLLKELKYDCNKESLMSILEEDNYLKIKFNTQKDFKPHSFELTSELKEKLKCIAKTLLNYQNMIIQIVGHSNDSISITHNRYLSNNRAIVASELLYKEGIPDIYAKGCPELKLIGEDDLFIDSSISIYIYSSEADIKNPCP